MKTKVNFRKWKDTKDVIALFPEDDAGQGLCGSYMHVGQHGGADYHGVIAATTPAMPDDYADLAAELKGSK